MMNHPRGMTTQRKKDKAILTGFATGLPTQACRQRNPYQHKSSHLLHIQPTASPKSINAC
ncbi:MAG: hypothetical protein GXY64_08355 [Bacteroidales bacterium]|nr:hypothetical protein [Bacteroidales bacterium]